MVSVTSYAFPQTGSPALALGAFLLAGAVFGLFSQSRALRVLSASYVGVYLVCLVSLLVSGFDPLAVAGLLLIPSLAGSFAPRRRLRAACLTYVCLYLGVLLCLALGGTLPRYMLFHPFLYASLLLYVHGVAASHGAFTD